ncbi:hypothetical protein TrST_g168 [Triparma strigata]|uniref:ribose-phosphate diphosphokinase n=1 Tax=Triparma strigata TaxID=1606541 RepID=A0A9W7EZ26_9STRA|nr:hypothetical protein TrST_g168 [Triparma strigata]
MFSSFLRSTSNPSLLRPLLLSSAAILTAATANNYNYVTNNTKCEQSTAPEAKRRDSIVEEGLTTRKFYFYNTPAASSISSKRTNIYTLPSSLTLSRDITSLLGLPLSRLSVGKYADGETSVKIDDGCRGKDVFVVCSTVDDDSLIECLLTISTLRRASAKSICCIIPYYGYSRSDQKKAPRTPIAAADISLMFTTMGVDSVICMDLHNDSLRGFWDNGVPVDHLQPVPVAAAWFYEEVGVEDLCVVAPHEGQVARASDFRKRLQKLSGVDVPMAFVSKSRSHHGTREGEYEPILVGEVKGKTVIIVDDIISSGNTMLKVNELLHDAGCSKSYGYATHGLFSSPTVLKEFSESSMEYVLVTNTIYHKKGSLPEKVKQLSVAPLVAEAVARTVGKRSVSGILNEEDE